MIVSVGPAARNYSARIQSLLGYSIHPPFMGHINGLHPLRTIDPTYDARSTNHAAVAAAVFEQPFG